MPNFISIWQVVRLEISKNHEKTHILRVKISHFKVKIKPWRHGAGQNLMKHAWKRIFRWFRISNQIFRRVFRSRDIRRSLDLIFAFLTKKAYFMDEYLENEASFWRAIFFCWSVLFSSTFWPKLSKIVRVVFEKRPKNRYFDHIFVKIRTLRMNIRTKKFFFGMKLGMVVQNLYFYHLTKN